jgi:hypothetical protein
MIAVYESVAFVARDQSWGVAQSHLRELMVLTNFLNPLSHDLGTCRL